MGAGTRGLLAGGSGLLLALSLTACGGSDSNASQTAATTPTTAVASPTPTPTPSRTTTLLNSTTSNPQKAGPVVNGRLNVCMAVTPQMVASDLRVNVGRAGGKVSTLGETNEVLDCLYTGDPHAPGETNVLVRGSVHPDQDLSADKYPMVAGAEPIPGADRGWVVLYDVYRDVPQAQVLLVKGQVGFEIDITSDNYGLTVDELQQFAHDILQSLG